MLNRNRKFESFSPLPQGEGLGVRVKTGYIQTYLSESALGGEDLCPITKVSSYECLRVGVGSLLTHHRRQIVVCPDRILDLISNRLVRQQELLR